MKRFTEHVEENHPGTISGFADVLSSNLEEFVNRLVSETNDLSDTNAEKVDVLHRFNTLYKKLVYLRGSDVQDLRYLDGRKRYRSITPVISHRLYTFLKDLKDSRNDHVHAKTNIYEYIKRFARLDILLKSEEENDGKAKLACVFKPHGESFLRFKGHSLDNAPCKGGLKFKKIAESELEFDLIPGTFAHHDLKMEIHTQKKAAKLKKNPVSADEKKHKHVLIIEWCNEQYYFHLSATAKSLVDMFTDLKHEDKETRYFKLNPYTTLKRIVALSYRE